MADQPQTSLRDTQSTGNTISASTTCQETDSAAFTTSDEAAVRDNGQEVSGPEGAQRGLPPGWEELVDDDGRTYYADHGSRQTTWASPTIDPDAGDLPPGWEMLHTGNGVAYFADHNTHTTTFTDPRGRQ